MNRQEYVLVVEREVVEALGMFQGLVFDVERYLERLFAPGVGRFILRSEAEEDPSYKQLIPYVIMNCADTYLTYVRGKRAGEGRLAGSRSIGIGGHINPADDRLPLFNENFYPAYQAAVKREVAEEVAVQTGYSDRIVALLNDERNDVGRVHLGIVHYWVLDAPNVQKREQMITQTAFMTADELRRVRDTLETWSALCLDRLDEMKKQTANTP